MVNITFEKDRNRAVAYDGSIDIGEATFAIRNGIWVFNHTYVSPDYAGQGIAKKLIAKLVEVARENEVKVFPTCSFAKKEFEKNEEYRDLLASL